MARRGGAGERGERPPPRAPRSGRAGRRAQATASAVDFARLATEAAHPDAAQLHRRPTAEVVRLLLGEEERSWRAAFAARRAIAAAAELVAECLGRGGRLIYVGAGTSGRLGAMDAAELGPTFGMGPGRAMAVVAGGKRALGRAVEGAEDRPAALRRAFRRLAVSQGDVVCAIAASGVTPFTRAALEEAEARGARRVFITAAPAVARALRGQVDVVVTLAVGPEVLAGSTRLKAATATKLAVSAISTAAMVRLGKVWRGRMVDLVATSAKLRDRAVRILVELGGLERAAAAALLAAAGGEVKLALASALLGVEVDEARRRLAAAGGDLERLVGRGARAGRRVSAKGAGRRPAG